MAFFSFAGSQLYIGPATDFQQDDFVAGDFTSIVSGDWDEVKNIVSIGQWGDTANFGTIAFLDSRREFSFLTTFGSSPTAINMARDPDDVGQQAILAASLNPNATYAAKIVLNDAPAGGTPTIDYFIARWSPMSRDGGGVQDPNKWTAQMVISSNIVTVNRAP